MLMGVKALTFIYAKRIIGRKFGDEYVSKFARSNEIPFSIVRAEGDQAAFEVTISGTKVIKTPEEVSAEVLKYIKKAASACLECEVTEAVISVPARFSVAQREATRKAAKLANLKVLRLVTEPTAAAIHYASDKGKNNTKILVFDFGGGTLDVSIIEVADKKFEVKAVYGDTFLGGRNIDEILFNHFQRKFLKDRLVSESRKRTFLRRLRIGCIEFKRKLSTNPEAKYPIASCFGADEEIYLTMSKNEFDSLTCDIFERALEIIDMGLKDYGISKTDIVEVVVVGGTTRIPKVREMLKSYFGGHKIKTDIHPDEAVAAGASFQAALLNRLGTDAALENYKITEVTPLSLGIEERCNLMKPLIPKNWPLPCKGRFIGETTNNNQESVLIKIFEGERKNTNYNSLLSEIEINGLPPRRAGDIYFTVKFRLDEDGVLSVRAHEKSTGVKKKLRITMDQFRLSERKIKMSTEEAEKRKHEDDTFEKFVLFKLQAEKSCKHILYDLNKISSEADQEFVERCCRDYLEISETLDFTKINELEGQFEMFNNLVSDILKSNCLLQIES
ncbi:hypothetical protein NQ314_016833 [Rhamnusium bicolor]|uniref:Uncharacterized protein n=1 Tax=Rhamnusium bicolor TaxID=1586634 RepID=A0AAV8WUD0_9CUCU|nr:hypothetical protein NQ314_016833 [Rhamnusium bicolor]